MENSFLNDKPFEIFVILAETLKGWQSLSTEEGRSVLLKHYAWGADLKKRGILILAGPTNFELLSSSSVINPVGYTTGLIMLNSSTLQEAQELAYKDPFHIYGYRKNVVHSMKITSSDNSLYSHLEKILL